MNPTENFDVIVIDAGLSGVFCVYELIQKESDMEILMVEKRRPVGKYIRSKRTTKVYIGCKPCSITIGFAGVGTFSGGKLSLSPDVGGNLPEILDYDKIIELLEEPDNIYLKLGADTDVYSLNRQKEIEEICRKAINANLKLIEHPIRHLGTKEKYEVYTRLQEHLLAQGVIMEFNAMVKDTVIEEDRVEGVLTDKDETCYAPEIVSVVSREGSDWFSHICGDHGIEAQVDTVDIGVRVEVRDEVVKFLNDNLYEVKLVYYTPTFDDEVRTFCTNPSDEVATEYYENGPAVVNGYIYKSKEYRTSNTSFALLVGKNFTKPLSELIEYGKYIAQLPNMLCGGRIVVQTFGNFQRGRRTAEERLCCNNLIPTLKGAAPGDLSLVLPHRIMVDIKGMPLALGKVAPDTASDEAPLCGVGIKFYSNKVVVNTDFEASIKGLWVIGDDASVICGLQQASANGISVVRSILKQMEA